MPCQCAINTGLGMLFNRQVKERKEIRAGFHNPQKLVAKAMGEFSS